jgi:hypothetical protein
MTYPIIGGALAFVLFLLRVLTLVSRRRIMRKAHTDYACCRGTIHARQLRAGIQKHERALRPLALEKDRIGVALESLARNELRDLRQALAFHLANGPLAEVRGIGPKLKDRVVEACFDGTLESLFQVEHVPGVGEEKAIDIRRWVEGMQSRIPQLLKGDFAGKQDVQAQYEQQRNELCLRRAKLDQLIDERRALLSQVGQRVSSLELITPTVYRAALKGDATAAERVAAHTVGAYPEWGPTPAWFTTITGDPDRELHEV